MSRGTPATPTIEMRPRRHEPERRSYIVSHAYARNYVHLVFGTNGRRQSIRGAMQDRMWEYLRGIARGYGVDVVEIGGIEDHVHILLCLPPKISLSTIVRVLKANSSKWMNENGHLFAWQTGYGAFSVSVSNLEAVSAYIRTQHEHHTKRDYHQEFCALLKKHAIEFTAGRVMG